MTEAATISVPRRARTPSRPLGDERLAERAAGGDESAFAAIYDRYQQELYRYCRSLLGNADDAEDALQSTMASALQSLPGERREIALRPWLYRVAHNHAITILRARRYQDGEERLASIPDRAVEGRPEARERLRQLLVDLDALPERQRAALTLRELSGLGFDEIGAALSVSAAAARQTVYEARIGLQEFERGREMDCERVKQAISGSDRRTLRGRRVRAHLRGCAGCRAFQAAIGVRRADLAALSPPLPLAAAAGLLDAILAGSGSAGKSASGVATASGVAGGATGGGGAIAGAGASGGGGAAAVLGAANGISASVALKSAASVIAIVAVGTGTADLAGVVRLPLLHGNGDANPTTSAPAGGGASAVQRPNLASGQTPGLAGSGESAATVNPAQLAGSAAPRHDHGSGSDPGRGDGRSSSPHGLPVPAHAQEPAAHAPAHGAPADAQNVGQPTQAQGHTTAPNHGSQGQPANPGSASSGSNANGPNPSAGGTNPNAGGSSATAQGANPSAGGANPDAGGGNPDAGLASPAPAAASDPSPTPLQEPHGEAANASSHGNSSR